MDDDYHHRYVVIVGPCAAGKSTLRDRMLARGFTQVRVVAQEHSGVRDLWKLRGYPDCLIFLDAEVPTANARQNRSDWTPAAHAEQLARLQHARAACDLYLPTDELSPDEVADQVEQFIAARPVL
jgi:chloramphenicol 3-O-phosphotransferase